MKNKGMNKQQQPCSGIFDTSAHCPHVYQVSIFSVSQFLTKNFNALMLENWRERKTKKIKR